MRCPRRQVLSGGIAVVFLLTFSSPAMAVFHFWDINEVFSSADGTIQFIEFHTFSDGQHLLGGHDLTSNGKSFTFPSHLASGTANKTFLVATSGFQSLAGAVAPDYTIPDNFFSVSGDTITLVGADSLTFGAGDLPTDGVTSIDDTLTEMTNSPKNYAGESGSIGVNDVPVITGQNIVTLQEDSSRQIVKTDLIVSDSDNDYPQDFTLSVQNGINYTRIGSTITPKADFFGTLTVPVTVNDGLDTSNTFNLSVTVTQVDDATVYVDFEAGSGGIGTAAEPFDTLEEALSSATLGATVIIEPGTSSAILTISQNVRLEANDTGGSVRIGVAGAKKRTKSTASQYDTDVGGIASSAIAALSASTETSDGGTGVGATGGEESVTHFDRVTHEPVLPYSTAAEGVHLAQTDSVLAVRLRSEEGIDPDSVWGVNTESSAEWVPVRDGDYTDIWVVFRPSDSWYLEDLMTVTAGAQKISGESIDPVTYEFQVETGEEYEARSRETDTDLWQPRYGEDFDASNLDLDAESNDEAQITQAGEKTPELSEGIAEPLAIGPEKVYETPQRVWLPLPDGVIASEVELYYYHPNGEDRGWYPAANVEGWLVPDSHLVMTLDGIDYLGFLVRHAGIVQLGRSAMNE